MSKLLNLIQGLKLSLLKYDSPPNMLIQTSKKIQVLIYTNTNLSYCLPYAKTLFLPLSIKIIDFFIKMVTHKSLTLLHYF